MSDLRRGERDRGSGGHVQHTHTHTHIVHLSTYRAAAAQLIVGHRSVTQGGEVQAGSVKPKSIYTALVHADAEYISAQMEEGQPDPPSRLHPFRPPLDATPSGECHRQF